MPPPPFRITGATNADWIIVIVGAIISVYWLRALRLAREGVRLYLRLFARAVLSFFILLFVLAALRLQTHLRPSQEEMIAVFLAGVLFGRWRRKKRSRYIPKSTKQAVIERDLKGETFDPQKHHIDH